MKLALKIPIARPTFDRDCHLKGVSCRLGVPESLRHRVRLLMIAVGLVLEALCFCLLLFPFRGLSADHSRTKFVERFDAEYWKAQLDKSVVIDSWTIGNIQIGSSWVRFKDEARFQNCSFQSPVYLFKSHFANEAFFDNSMFYSLVEFGDSRFDSSAYFTSDSFHGPVHFKYSSIHHLCLFYSSVFDSLADFSSLVDSGSASWSTVIFKRDADFSGSSFRSIVNFRMAVFSGVADFSWLTISDPREAMSLLHDDSTGKRATGTEFDSSADFSGTIFGRKADFRRAAFKGSVSFTNCTLPDTLDFRDVRDIKYNIDFTAARMPLSGKRCEIALLGTDLQRIKISMRLFHPCFLDTMVAFEQKMSVYEALLKKMRDDGLEESAELLDIEYRDSVYSRSGWIDRNVVNPWQRIWWNYGYDKGLVLWRSLEVFFFFVILNLFLLDKLVKQVYTVPNFEEAGPRSFAGSGMRLRRSIIYTAIIFFGLTLDIKNFKHGATLHGWLLSYVLLVFIIGLFCVGYIVSVVIAH